MDYMTVAAAGIYDTRIAAKNKTASIKRRTTLFEIEFAIEDGGTLFIGSDSRPVRRGLVICAKPGQLRHAKYPFRCFYVHLILRDEKLYQALAETPDFIENVHPAVYEGLFQKLIANYNTLSGPEEILLQSTVLELIYTLCREAAVKDGKNRSAGHQSVEKAVRYIQENLTEDLCLEKIARAVSLSPVYFHSLFKAAVGKTVRDFTEEQRVKKAIHLLQTTDDSLTHIAMECGFSSQSYFSYVFKRRMKLTPRKYIREMLRKYEM